jgi:hypothetical protein
VLLDILVPATFLVVGLSLAFAFNHALAAIRDPQTFDPLLARIDTLIFHASATQIAHASLRYLPISFFHFLEVVYFSLYPRLIGVFLLCVLLRDRNYGMKYMRTLLMCFAIAVVTYVFLPAKGPYSTCTLHAFSYPQSLTTFWSQKGLVDRSHALWTHNLSAHVIPVMTEDYYISFPSLHVALPIIAIWFMRPFRRLQYVLAAAYLLLMLPAVMLLEWHYIIDFAGGFCAAALSIWLAERVSTSSVLGKSLVKVITP